MSTRSVKTLRDVRLLGLTPRFREGQDSRSREGEGRFTVLIAPEQAAEITAEGVRLTSPARNGQFWLSGRFEGAYVHDDIPNPWGKPYGFLVRGDVVISIGDSPRPENLDAGARDAPTKTVAFMGVRVTYRPTWTEFVARMEESL